MTSSFISRAACRGRRPIPCSDSERRSRSVLVTRLLKERTVARFIIAPNGYGKTTLALEYGETMFEWVHCFWISAQSPCFLRDVDAGTLASACLEYDGDAALVVIDDLPALDAERAECFSGEIDKLLDSGCEVLVTCKPGCDIAGTLQKDRICLRSRDLLLDDSELDALRTPQERRTHPADEIPEAGRIAAIAWAADESSAEEFALECLSEELPLDIQLLMTSVLMLGRCTIDDLRSLMPAGYGAIEEISVDYPHLGFDVQTGSFEPPYLEVPWIARPLRRQLDAMASKASCGSEPELIMEWARILLDQGEPKRACEVVSSLCSRKEAALWVAEHGFELVRAAQFIEPYAMARARKGVSGATKHGLMTLEALCARMLGDEKESLRIAVRVFSDKAAPLACRICTAIIVEDQGKETPARQARKYLGNVVQMTKEPTDEKERFWRDLASLRLACITDMDEAVQCWHGQAKAEVSTEALCLGASWIFTMLARAEEDDLGRPRTFPKNIEMFVRNALEGEQGIPRDFFVVSAALAMEEAHDHGVQYNAGSLDARTLMDLRNSEMSVLSQRAELSRQKRREAEAQGRWTGARDGGSMPSIEGAIPAEADRVPPLTLRLFGGFTVMLGERFIEQRSFHRQNTRVLLALLTIHQGREVSREVLARAMWPNSDIAVAKKNFYTIWAELRRCLSLPDGTCPYLIKHQYGCSLDHRYVSSDIMRFSEICRELLFGKPDLEEWSALFEEIDRDFSSDLMPSEHNNQLIVRSRDEYRSRLVDALIAATLNIVSAHHPECGIWFARSAINHDETREDAYVALMKAQIACNQRTAAMMTFLKCRKVLDEQLGIDPSPEAAQIYNELLEGGDMQFDQVAS